MRLKLRFFVPPDYTMKTWTTDWDLPVIPHKGEMFNMYVKYKIPKDMDDGSLQLTTNSLGSVLCTFIVEGVTYTYGSEVVEVRLSFVAPTLKEE